MAWSTATRPGMIPEGSPIRGVEMKSCGDERESRTRSDRDESFRKIEFSEQKVDMEQTIERENRKSS